MLPIILQEEADELTNASSWIFLRSTSILGTFCNEIECQRLISETTKPVFHCIISSAENQEFGRELLLTMITFPSDQLSIFGTSGFPYNKNNSKSEHSEICKKYSSTLFLKPKRFFQSNNHLLDLYLNFSPMHFVGSFLDRFVFGGQTAKWYNGIVKLGKSNKCSLRSWCIFTVFGKLTAVTPLFDLHVVLGTFKSSSWNKHPTCTSFKSTKALNKFPIIRL